MPNKATTPKRRRKSSHVKNAILFRAQQHVSNLFPTGHHTCMLSWKLETYWVFFKQINLHLFFICSFPYGQNTPYFPDAFDRETIFYFLLLFLDYFFLQYIYSTVQTFVIKLSEHNVVTWPIGTSWCSFAPTSSRWVKQARTRSGVVLQNVPHTCVLLKHTCKKMKGN